MPKQLQSDQFQSDYLDEAFILHNKEITFSNPCLIMEIAVFGSYGGKLKGGLYLYLFIIKIKAYIFVQNLTNFDFGVYEIK